MYFPGGFNYTGNELRTPHVSLSLPLCPSLSHIHTNHSVNVSCCSFPTSLDAQNRCQEDTNRLGDSLLLPGWMRRVDE